MLDADMFMGLPLGGGGVGGSLTPGNAGVMQAIDNFYKALTAAGGSDVAALTGGAALRRESIELALLEVVQRPEHFVLFNKIAKAPATSMLHEFTQRRDIGGIPGSGATGETRAIALTQGDYRRQVVKMKLLKDRRIVTYEAELQASNGLAGAIALETNAGALKLGTDAEYLLFYGDETCNSFEFTGLVKILSDLGGDHVLDMRGNPLSSDAREFVDSARMIWDQGNWGQATDYFCSGAVQADMDLSLAPGYRIHLNGAAQNVIGGAPLMGVETRFGKLMSNPDTFIQESQPPYVTRGGNFAAQLSTSGTSVVSSVAGVPGAHASSKFLAAHAGNYYYGVQATRPDGDSALVLSAQVAIGAGERVVLTITPPANNNAEAYRIFRGRKNGTNAPSDLREIARIPANGDVAVVYNDDNQSIPGTSVVIILTMLDQAIELLRFQQMMRFPLAATDNTIYTWAQILDIALMVGKERQHRLIKNVLPSTATWRPF